MHKKPKGEKKRLIYFPTNKHMLDSVYLHPMMPHIARWLD